MGAVRVNSRKRHEAYVSLDGFPCDVLFDGFGAQNRAVRSTATQNCLLASPRPDTVSDCSLLHLYRTPD